MKSLMISGGVKNKIWQADGGCGPYETWYSWWINNKKDVENLLEGKILKIEAYEKQNWDFILQKIANLNFTCLA